MNQANKSSRVTIVAGVLLAVCHVQWGMAGTQGAYMNSAGFGKASDRIVFGGRTNVVTSPAQYNPCAAVNAQSLFACSFKTNLPPGTATNVFCQSKGVPNYIWSIQSYVTGGATADNPDLDNRVNITPADCASYSLVSTGAFNDEFSGTIIVNANATRGTALLLRGFEFLGGGTPQSLDDLKSNALINFDILEIGPLNQNSSNCTALVIPFTTQTGHTNLYFVVDAEAKSNPFTVTCPTNVVFGCNTTNLVYPQVQVTGGCGNVSVSYSPPVTNLVDGVPTLVTVTATDQNGNIAQCNFTATRNILGFSGFFSPINGTGGSCSNALRNINLGSNIPIKFDTFCSGSLDFVGQPTLVITKCPSPNPILAGNFQIVANVWHFNWDTSGLSKGVYQLIATLQDGTTRTVFVKLQ